MSLVDSNEEYRSAIRLGFFVCVLVFISYVNSIRNSFILDDLLVVASNPEIRSIQPLRFLTHSYWGDQITSGIYRPLTILSFSLEYNLWQRWVSGFRAVNLLLHALNGVLAFLLAREITGSARAAWATACVYVVHPVHTEAVVGIVGRSEVMAATFFFSAWLIFRKGRTGWACVLFALSLLSKESAIMFPAIMVLDLALMRGGKEKILNTWRELGAIVGVAVAYLALRLSVLGSLGVAPNDRYLHGTLSLVERWMTAGRVTLQYLRLLIAPVSVSGDYDFNSISVAGLRSADAWLGLTLVASAIVFACTVRRVRGELRFGILFICFMMLPASDTLMPITVLMAERFLYIPLFGLALIAGVAWQRLQLERSGRLLIGSGVLGVCVVLCIGHNFIWQDNLTFYGNMVRVLPNNVRGRLGYGFALLEVARASDARAQFEAGLRIAPESAPLLTALASSIMWSNHGKCENAQALLSKALALDPHNWRTIWVMADCAAAGGNPSQAEGLYRRSAALNPFPDPKLLLSWGMALETLGRQNEALSVYQEAALIDPNEDRIRNRLHMLKQAMP
jgi:Flp pilus assembly protein TadD